MRTGHKNNLVESPKRVFLADPFSMVRHSVAEWLRKTPDLTVCGQAHNAASALKAISEAKPDIVVTEIFGEADCQFIETLHKQYPSLPILVFSYGNENWYAPRALEAGADGYMLKGVNAHGLVDGIRRTLEGHVVLSRDLRYQLLYKCVRSKKLPRIIKKSRCLNVSESYLSRN